MQYTKAQSTILRLLDSLRESYFPPRRLPLMTSYHAWESVARKHLNALDPSTITTIETSFTRMVRRFREPGEERRWRNSGKQDGAGSGTGLSKGDEESESEEVYRRYGSWTAGDGRAARTLRSLDISREKER